MVLVEHLLNTKKEEKIKKQELHYISFKAN